MTNIYSNLIPQISINPQRVAFKSNSTISTPAFRHADDKFVSNPLLDNSNLKTQIELDAKNNSRINELMSEYNLPIKVNMKELEKLQVGHLQDTRVIAAKMYSSLPSDLKAEVNMSDLQQAAMYHDYGKVLIPDNILNKTAKLTNEERKIIELHSEIGYELLKDKGLNDNTLNLIKYHHQNNSQTGYPAITNGYQNSIEAQILTTADKYSALREKRSYKEALSNEEALSIIANDVEQGEISPEVYEALVKSIQL